MQKGYSVKTVLILGPTPWSYFLNIMRFIYEIPRARIHNHPTLVNVNDYVISKGNLKFLLWKSNLINVALYITFLVL